MLSPIEKAKIEHIQTQRLQEGIKYFREHPELGEFRLEDWVFFLPPQLKDAKIIVLGVGKKGCQASEYMLGKIECVGFVDVRCETEPDVWDSFKVPIKFDVQSADACKKVIDENCTNSDIIFIIGDSPLTPCLANATKDLGILTIGIVLSHDEELKNQFKEASDALISFEKDTSWDEQINLAKNAVQSIANLITKSGFINLEIGDVKNILQDIGTAFIGTGHAKWDDSIQAVALQTVNVSEKAKHAKRVLLNITAGNDVSLTEISEAVEIVKKAVASDAQIMCGHVISNFMNNTLKVTFIAGMDDKN